MAATWLLGCGGANGGAPPGTTVAGGGGSTTAGTTARVAHTYAGPPLAPAVRSAALRNAMGKYYEVHGQPLAQANQALAAYLKSLPDFEDAAATSTGVWGRFKDGRVAVMINDPAADAAVAAKRKHAARDEGIPHMMLGAAVPGGDIPAGKKFRAYDIIGVGGAARSDIAGWLGSQGYTDGGGSGSVDDMKFGADDGAIYLNTHGAWFWSPTTDAQGRRQQIYSMMTTTPVLDERGQTINHDVARMSDLPPPSGQYESMLQDGHLIYAFGALASGDQWNYGITSLWVQDYWQFGASPFVMLAVCSSMARTPQTGGNPGEAGASQGYEANAQPY